VRAAFYAVTLYEFNLTIEGMDSNSTYPGLGFHSLQALMGLYIQCQGQFGTFLYTDPTDNAVTGQVIGIGDGATTIFTLLRSLGASTEPAPGATSYPTVYLNGIVQTSGWALTTANVIEFTTAPLLGSVISADFTYAFTCRFLDDKEDFENFMSGLWQVQSLKFRSVKPATPFFPISYPSLVGPLPETDPGVPGKLWSDGGLVAISEWTSPFIGLPTSPPFARGTLWNNGGLLSISGWDDPLIPLPSTLPAIAGVFWNNQGSVAWTPV
jgi:hypothetical protein